MLQTLLPESLKTRLLRRLFERHCAGRLDRIDEARIVAPDPAIGFPSSRREGKP